jgi:hypothetical protein
MDSAAVSASVTGELSGFVSTRRSDASNRDKVNASAASAMCRASVNSSAMAGASAIDSAGRVAGSGIEVGETEIGQLTAPAYP